MLVIVGLLTVMIHFWTTTTYLHLMQRHDEEWQLVVNDLTSNPRICEKAVLEEAMSHCSLYVRSQVGMFAISRCAVDVHTTMLDSIFRHGTDDCCRVKRDEGYFSIMETNPPISSLHSLALNLGERGNFSAESSGSLVKALNAIDDGLGDSFELGIRRRDARAAKLAQRDQTRNFPEPTIHEDASGR